VLLTKLLNSFSGSEYSEMNVSCRLYHSFDRLFFYWLLYGPCGFSYKLLFNFNKRIGDSLSASTKRRSRPHTLVTASGCTFLVGEDKCSSLICAKSNLEG
jgi:hypothetical protein